MGLRQYWYAEKDGNFFGKKTNSFFNRYCTYDGFHARGTYNFGSNPCSFK